MAKLPHRDNTDDDGRYYDGLASVRRWPAIVLPRAMMGYHSPPLLALPPSANGPPALAEMHVSSTTTVVEDKQPLVCDVVPRILSYCDARTLSRASGVCRSWRIMANADELWTELCKEVFGVAPFELNPPPDPTRILYVMSHMRLRETLSLGNKRHGGWGLTGGRNVVIPASAFGPYFGR